jgi:hypothetical protein
MMTTMSQRFLPMLALGALTLAACEGDGTGPDGFATDELTTALAIAPDHFHIYETEGTFSVAVTDPDGEPVTDFEVMRLERRVVGTLSWSALELVLDGDLYVGKYTFEASGNYELRVSGMRSADEGLLVLYEADTPLSVVRAHADLGGRRLELENIPGHIHAGDQSQVTFWIMDPQRNGQGIRPPITGLATTIWVEVNGVRTNYATLDWDPGVYAATHRFTAVGSAFVGIRFLGSDGQEHEWSMEIEVHPPH